MTAGTTRSTRSTRSGGAGRGEGDRGGGGTTTGDGTTTRGCAGGAGGEGGTGGFGGFGGEIPTLLSWLTGPPDALLCCSIVVTGVGKTVGRGGTVGRAPGRAAGQGHPQAPAPSNAGTTGNNRKGVIGSPTNASKACGEQVD